MGLKDKAKKAAEDGDEVAEAQASQLDGLAGGIAPTGVAAEALQHELDRALAAAKAQEEESRRAESALRDEVRKLASEVETLRAGLSTKDLEGNDLKIELARERALAKQEAAETGHRADVIGRELATARATLKTREGEILRLEREVAALRGEVNEARQTAESKVRDLRGELQTSESEATAGARKLREATDEVESLKQANARLEKAAQARGQELGARERGLAQRQAQLEKAEEAAEVGRRESETLVRKTDARAEQLATTEKALAAKEKTLAAQLEKVETQRADLKARAG